MEDKIEHLRANMARPSDSEAISKLTKRAQWNIWGAEHPRWREFYSKNEPSWKGKMGSGERGGTSENISGWG